MGQSNDTTLASHAAKEVFTVFCEYHQGFLEITARAAKRFGDGDVQGLLEDAIERLDDYRGCVRRAMAALEKMLGADISNRDVWAAMKRAYSGLIKERQDWEIAETFFNSVSRKVFVTTGVDPSVEFVDSDFEIPSEAPQGASVRRFSGEASTVGWLRSLLAAYDFACDNQELVNEIAARVDARWVEAGMRRPVEGVEAWEAVFYRGDRAHIIGRMRIGEAQLPLVLVARNDGDSPQLEAVLLYENDVSILFSFTRAYFHVRAPAPSALVHFMRSILPRKSVSELYSSIGYHRHGKTELYRQLLDYLRHSDETFEPAPGTPGMVMAAFVLPGFRRIFKVIRDEFPRQKATTRERVMEKYAFVFRRDRAGRLVEAQLFEHLVFDRARFSNAVLKDLAETCAKTVEFTGTHVVLHHVYIERRVTPLNLYLDTRREHEASNAVVDLGYAIKDLASTNIFPGDILTKNFGVTSNGRVVFYDYDEIMLLEDCVFRDKPQPRTLEQELASEPWYVVGEHDIFPEEFRTFMGLMGRYRELFEVYHRDLFTAAGWQDLQQQVASGNPPDVQPFSRRCLL